MSRFIALLLLVVALLCSSLHAGAQTTHTPPDTPPDTPLAAPADCPPLPAALGPQDVAQGMRQAQDHGLMWRIEKNGRTSWLYGTVHAAQLAWMFPGPQVMSALRASHRVALELDMLDPAVQRHMQQAMRAEPDLAPLPPALAQRLARQAQAECAEQALQGLRPEMQMAVLSLLSLRRSGLEPGYGLDGFLSGLARGLGKTVVSLETPQSQMAALRVDDHAERARQVADALDSLLSGQAQRQVLQLTQAWARGDLAYLERYPQWCDCLNTPGEQQAMRRLLDERNPAMARQIARWHQGGLSVFAAVGALHLIGPQGLPALLAAQGFTVQAVVLRSAQSNLDPVPSSPEHGDTL